ncbi:alpha/beta-hydrolase [Pseudovirgaria hyperparasitica]|uniref:Alpha/beta-hydrolase n=1 Tax=Pseudovirgaria hyperparasitica TaxID=470096 RepID=A0A6A6W3K4_9PEZI|nr:alpha/beta-hydrolase [Pseudovirgaria hyperparasitica]KAF2756556.1 alpha/beta-hydrolase [Pseudovirgaria hyperparasitica]
MPPHLISSSSFTLPTATHSLSFTLHTPLTPPTPTAPLIIIFPGYGDVAYSWHRVVSLLALRFSVLTYDRSGLGASLRGPNRALAAVAASELCQALSNRSAPPVPLPSPPYVLLAHSYGALVAREFLALDSPLGRAGECVKGMVLVDPASEKQHEYFDFELVDRIGEGVSLARATGLRAKSRFTDEEWRTRVRLMTGGLPAAKEEGANFVEHCRSVRALRQIERRALGKRPLSVVLARSRLDYEAVLTAGVARGNGTVEEREKMRSLLGVWDAETRRLAAEQLGMSENAKLVEVECGHNVHLLRPDVVAGEVEWVMTQLEGKIKEKI